MMSFDFGLVAETAYVCSAVEDVVESIVCFRDSWDDSLVAASKSRGTHDSET